MNDSGALPAMDLLITDLGDHTYRLTLGNQRGHVAITATASQLERWTGEIRAAIGATPARTRPYAGGQYPYRPGVERA